MTSTLKSNKGRPVRVLDGYTMLFHYLHGQTEYWRCSKYTVCPARARLSMDTGEFSLSKNSGHNHIPDPTSPVKRERIQKLKEAATSNLATPSSAIAENAQSGLDPQELHAFPTLRALQQTVNATRKLLVGAGNADKEPGAIDLPNLLRLTERNERFLVADSRDINRDWPVFLAFGSDKAADMLRANMDWSIDGTFYSAPHHFKCLLLINAMVKDSALPAVYIVLPDRRMATYERAFRAVFESHAFRGISPTSILCGK